jgi:hypothetical protein
VFQRLDVVHSQHCCEIEYGLQEIAACNAALAKANNTAQKLRLSQLLHALSALNQSAQAIQQLSKDFGTGTDKDLLGSLEAAEIAIDALGTVPSRRKA